MMERRYLWLYFGISPFWKMLNTIGTHLKQLQALCFPICWLVLLVFWSTCQIHGFCCLPRQIFHDKRKTSCSVSDLFYWASKGKWLGAIWKNLFSVTSLFWSFPCPALNEYIQDSTQQWATLNSWECDQIKTLSMCVWEIKSGRVH